MATSPEDAVRTYLRWREDPESIRPDTGELDARIESEQDPVERVKLRSERARRADLGPTIEADFVAHVAEWAHANEVSADALLEEGVERRLLAEAGLISGAARSSKTRSSRSGSAPAGSTRAKRTSRGDIESYIRGLRAGTTFVTATVSNDVGGSVGTIRKVLDVLMEEGAVAEAGKDHSGPGRPRTLYERR